MRWYGSVNNRLEEGRNYTGRDLQAGDDITMYMWSDRDCYYITEVIDSKHIKVKPYYICADHSKAGGHGHQDWLYFKSNVEMSKYLNSVFKDREVSNEEFDDEQLWTFRYGSWRVTSIWTKAEIDAIRAKDSWRANLILSGMNEKQRADLEARKKVTTYNELSGKVSFGVRDYYYDWEF